MLKGRVVGWSKEKGDHHLSILKRQSAIKTIGTARQFAAPNSMKIVPSASGGYGKPPYDFQLEKISSTAPS
jgi:hypothetical protein